MGASPNLFGAASTDVGFMPAAVFYPGLLRSSCQVVLTKDFSLARSPCLAKELNEIFGGFVCHDGGGHPCPGERDPDPPVGTLALPSNDHRGLLPVGCGG